MKYLERNSSSSYTGVCQCKTIYTTPTNKIKTTSIWLLLK